MISDLVGGTKVGAGKTAAPAAATPVVPPTPVVVASNKPAEAKPAPAKPVEAKPAEPKPVPAPASKPVEPAKSGNLDSEVAATVDGWLAAWSRKDVKSYLAHYAPDFQTPKGQPRKAWENERSQRVGKPGKIEVGRDKLSIKPEGGDKAVARFRQHYKSAGFKSSSGKTLVLIKRNGKWLIQQERVGG
jgi:ketosteroid isomerase-like protein